jgi:hypothetical protein
MNLLRKLFSRIFSILNDNVTHSKTLAQKTVELIPANCPFERNIPIFGLAVIHIPPLCKLNPLYEDFAMLRFNALTALAETYHLDITQYIS